MSSKSMSDNRYKLEALQTAIKEWQEFYSSTNRLGDTLVCYTTNAINGQALDPNILTRAVPNQVTVDENLPSTNYLAHIRSKFLQYAEENGMGFAIVPNGNSSLKSTHQIKEAFDKIMQVSDLQNSWSKAVQYVLNYGYCGLVPCVEVVDGKRTIVVKPIHPKMCYFDTHAIQEFKQDGMFSGYFESISVKSLLAKYKGNSKLKEYCNYTFYKIETDKYKQHYITVCTHFEKIPKEEEYIMYDIDEIYDEVEQLDLPIVTYLLKDIKDGGFKTQYLQRINGATTALGEILEENPQMQPLVDKLLAIFQRAANKPKTYKVSNFYVKKTTFVKTNNADYFITLEEEDVKFEELPLLFCGSTSRAERIDPDSMESYFVESAECYFGPIMPLMVRLNRNEVALTKFSSCAPIVLATANNSESSTISIANTNYDNGQLVFFVPSGQKLQDVVMQLQPTAGKVAELLQERQQIFAEIDKIVGLNARDYASPQDAKSNLTQVMRFEQMQEALKRLHAPLVNTYNFVANMIKNALSSLDFGVGYKDALYDSDKYNIQIKVEGGSALQKQYESATLQTALNMPIIQGSPLLTQLLSIEMLKTFQTYDTDVAVKVLEKSLPNELNRYSKGNLTDEQFKQFLDEYNAKIQQQTQQSNEAKMVEIAEKSAHGDEMKGEAAMAKVQMDGQIEVQKLQLEDRKVAIKEKEVAIKEAEVLNKIKEDELPKPKSKGSEIWEKVKGGQNARQ